MAQFREHVTSLIGKSIRLGRGGPDGTQGVLVAVKSDYLCLLSEDGSLVHYPVHHLRSITELVNAEPDEDLDLSGDEIDALPDTLHGLLQAYTGLKVQVFDHGPESAAGIVFGTGDDFVKLVTSPDEMVHYPFFHIRSVRLARLPQQNNNNNNKQDGSGNQGKSGQGKSGQGNRRGQSGSGNRRRRRNRGQTGTGQGQTGRGQSGRGQSGRGQSGRGQSGRGQSGRGQTGGGRGRRRGQTGTGQTGGGGRRRNRGQTGGKSRGQSGGKK